MALCTINEVATDWGCFPNDPVQFVQKFYGFGLSFVGAVALIALIIGGYNIMLSKGDPQRVNVGRSWIIYAIGGLLLAVFGFVFMQALAGDILKIPGFNN